MDYYQVFKDILTVASLVFGIVMGIVSFRRNSKKDVQEDASQLTTVIIKLENIGNGIAEIKSEMTNVKNDIKEDRERIIRIEESCKQAHKRLDKIDNYKRSESEQGSRF